MDPDWTAAATTMDATVPATMPVATALLARLPEPAAGAQVIDLACGTGQPALVLARTRPDLRITGVDAAPAKVERAREKAAEERLDQVRFAVMTLEALDFADGSADAAISQFGFLQHGDPQRSAAELARVLRPAAPFSVATWDHMGLNALISTLNRVIGEHAPPELMPDFSASNALAVPGLRQRYLREAGISSAETELFGYEITMPAFDAVLRAARQPATFGRAFSSLAPPVQHEVADQLREEAAGYRRGESYVFPVECRLTWGRR